MDGDSRNGFKDTSLDGLPILVEHVLPQAHLITVRGRGNDTYQPPTTHLGQPLQDQSPFNVATLAIDYLSSLIEEAKRLS
jgi:hypothetical protein